MKLEPRPVIHMEKQLGWAHKLDGAESLGISKAGRSNSVRQVDGVSDTAPVCQLCEGAGLQKGQWLLLILLPSTSVSLSKPLVPFKLLPWCCRSEGVSLSR